MAWAQKGYPVNIFVGNLAFTVTEQDVRELFAPYGVVDRINLITDRDTGRLRGFGFVEMADDRAAQAAIAGLNGKELAGRASVGRGPHSLALRKTIEAYARTITATSGAHTMPKELKNKREAKKKP